LSIVLRENSRHVETDVEGSGVDWKQFVASVIGSLAWPLAGVTLAAVFRNQIREKLSQIKKFGAAGVNFEISEQVKEVQKAGEAVELEQANEPRDAVVLDPGLVLLAKGFPEAAVLQAFKGLEAVLLRIRHRLPDDKPHRNLNEVLNALADDGQISQNVITLFQRLRQARNTAAHAKDEESMTPGEAIELIGQMKNLQDLLETVLKKMPPKSNRV
jgi:hypothetical protein